MDTCAELFEAMPARFNADAAPGWETKILFDIAGDGGGQWTVEIKDGACSVTEGAADDAKATLRTDAATWLGVSKGTVNPMQAFMAQKLKVEGDMSQLMKLQNPQIFKPA